MRPYPLVLSFAIVAAPAWAQDSVVTKDSLPLHRGQWAMQIAGVISLAPPPPSVIGISVGTAGVGLLRFTSPRSAWAINVTVSGGHSHTTTSDTGGTSAQYTSAAALTVRVGPRSYHAVMPSVALFHTFGILGSFGHQCFVQPFPPSSCQNGWNAGVFGDFGGEYFPTRFFSLGSSIGASFSYGRSYARISPTRKVTTWSYGGSLTGVSFVATFHF
ncbi:MAG TPA: hypothetical protein VF923_03390 [Gemmatimonadales bacterium]